MNAELDALLDRLDVLHGRPRTVSELSGGLTNRNYKVVTPEGGYVVRVSGLDTDLLAIDREHEYHDSRAAATAGVGAPVVGYLRGEGVLAVGLIEGVTLDDGGVRANLDRIAAACRQLHAGPRFAGQFDMFAIQRRYRAIVAERGFRVPVGYDDYAPRLEQVAQALAVGAGRTVPCNNDLLAANFIDDGTRIWIIDYEYAGNNDSCFELGNLAAECRLDVGEVELLIAAYYGRPRPDQVARARLFGLAAHYGWTLWASIQASSSTIDFDFWAWGMAKYTQAVAMFADPGLDDLLSAATGSAGTGPAGPRRG